MDPAVTAKGNIRVTHYLGRSRMDRPHRSIMAAMDAMEENTGNSNGPAVGDAFILITDGIHKIVPDRDSMNDGVAELLPYYHSGSSSLTCARFYSVLTFMKSAIIDNFQNMRFLRSMKCSTLWTEHIAWNYNSRPFLMGIRMYPYHSEIHGALFDLDFEFVKGSAMSLKLCYQPFRGLDATFLTLAWRGPNTDNV